MPERLRGLLQLLRRHRAPGTGTVLARKLGISILTLYREEPRPVPLLWLQG